MVFVLRNPFITLDLGPELSFSSSLIHKQCIFLSVYTYLYISLNSELKQSISLGYIISA